MHPGDEAIMKIHKKLFSGIPINFTFFVVFPKLQRIWSWNFGFATRKIWAFIWYQKMYYFRLSPGGWECDRHKDIKNCGALPTEILMSLLSFSDSSLQDAFYTVKIITPYEVKRGSLCKMSKILLEMEWKLTQNGVNFTQSYSII